VTPDVTVVIVNHNTKDDLLACLESLAAAAADLRLQVLVVDNHSSDGSADAVARSCPQARLLIPPTNTGFGHACNLGIAEAEAPFVAFLNADIVCGSGCLERMVDLLDAQPRAAAVGPLLRNSDGTLQTSAYRFPTLPVEFAGIYGLRSLLPIDSLRRSRARALFPATGHFDPHDELREVDYVTAACVVVRRAAVEQIGGFDEDFFLYYEEIDLCRRLGASGWRVFHLPEAHAIHHLNRSGAQQPTLVFLARQQSRLRFHAKYRGPLGFLGLRAMLGVRVAAAELRSRLAPRAGPPGSLDASHYRQVLRWCYDPASLPNGSPCSTSQTCCGSIRAGE